VEEVGIPAAVRVDEEVAEAVLIWPGRADQIVQVTGKRDAFAGRRVDVDAVTLKVTVVAEIAIIRNISICHTCMYQIYRRYSHSSCCAFVDGHFDRWGGEDDGCRERGESGGELHSELVESVQVVYLFECAAKLCST
jgi:hypothetical protein